MRSRSVYARRVSLQSTKGIVGAVWVLSAVIIGAASDVTSASAFIALAIFALLPPLAIVFLWNDVPRTADEIGDDGGDGRPGAGAGPRPGAAGRPDSIPTPY